jgi:putative ubiquitin-RnfH superfamily antitoxin RatB of RatAB toxin-antitoxin module
VRPGAALVGVLAAAIERAAAQPDGDRVVVGHISRTLGIPVEVLRRQRAQAAIEQRADDHGPSTLTRPV